MVAGMRERGPYVGQTISIIRPGGRGRFIMKLVSDTVDYGAPEFSVTGTAELERISDGQVRIAKYSRRGGQNVITHYEVWPAEEFERVQPAYRKFRMTENKDKFAEVS